LLKSIGCGCLVGKTKIVAEDDNNKKREFFQLIRRTFLLNIFSREKIQFAVGHQEIPIKFIVKSLNPLEHIEISLEH
jgi:hypothetical protein